MDIGASATGYWLHVGAGWFWYWLPDSVGLSL